MITAQPVDTATTAGTATRLTVTATGANLSYQWQRSRNAGASWDDLAGATRSTLELPAPTLAEDGALFRVVVSSGTARVVSSAVRLTVAAAVEAPSISLQPVPATVVAGASARFAVTAAGTALAFQWQLSGDGGDTWADIAGATSPTLELPAVAVARNGERLRVRLSNSAGTLLSEAVVLVVTPAPAAPSFTRQPVAASVTAPSAARFTAEAVGVPVPALQWQRSNDAGATWTDIAGATGTEYSTGATALADNGARFRVVARNESGIVASEVVALAVAITGTAPEFISVAGPVDRVVQDGENFSFTVAVLGNPVPTVQWQLSTDGGLTFGNINGATSWSYSQVGTLANSGHLFRAVASNALGSATSRTARVTVNPAPAAGTSRVWSAGLPTTPEEGSVEVLHAVQVDAVGRMTALFSQTVGGRVALVAVAGEPGEPAGQPSLQPPQIIDVGVPHDMFRPAALAVSPNGRAVAAWFVPGPCSGCWTLQAARRSTPAGAWETPVALGQIVMDSKVGLRINDAGDVVASFDSVTGVPARTTLSQAAAVVWWPRGTPVPASPRFWFAEPGADSLQTLEVVLDGRGRFVVFGHGAEAAGAAADAVVYRGTMASGVGPRERLDTLATPAESMGAWSNEAGHFVLAWAQAGVAGARGSARFAALEPDSAAFAIHDTPIVVRRSDLAATALTPQGDFVWHYPPGACASIERRAGVWQPQRVLPRQACVSGTSQRAREVNTVGDVLGIDTSGLWYGYVRATNGVDSFTPDFAGGRGYVAGVPGDFRFNPLVSRLAPNGTAVVVMRSGGVPPFRLHTWFLR